MIARRHSNLLSYSLILNLVVLAYLLTHTLFGNSDANDRNCPAVPTNLSHRERVRQIEEQQLQRLVASAAEPARSDVVLKHLNAEEAFNSVIEDERRDENDEDRPDDDDGDGDDVVASTTDVPQPEAETPQQAAQTPEIDEANGPQSWEAAEENATAQISVTEQRIALLIDCQDGDNRAETLQRGEHWVLKNFLRAEHGRLRCFETITYTTHADYTFLDNLQPLLERWQAPISIALFAPGTDLAPTLESIRYVRDCGPNSDLVRQYATFHLYFPNAHLPASLPSANDLVKSLYDCSQPPPYENITDAQLYKTTHNLLYPVNVGRNIARDAAMTHFLLASDIELYPNPGLPQQFLEMIARNEDPALRGTVPRLWPLVLFEVEADAQVPVNKTVLQTMLANGTAISFHKRVCAVCHGVPRSEEWMTAKQTEYLSVFHVGKRVGKQYHWEPIYIGTHADPHYDERLSWEGKSDKMTQGYALCALDYEFQILNNAFLVHRPGIKVYKNDVKRSALANKTNQLIKNVIFKELKLMYGTRKGCKL